MAPMIQMAQGVGYVRVAYKGVGHIATNSRSSQSTDLMGLDICIYCVALIRLT